MATIEKYLAPQSIEEVAQAMAENNTTLLAGGTDLMPQIQSENRVPQGVLINIRRIVELQTVTEAGGNIRIGGLTTITEILESRLLEEQAPVLTQTANCFASDQIRNMATIGGNICNASPAGDMIIPLLLLDAEVELTCWTGGKLTIRTVGLCDFFQGPGQTRIQHNEILTFIRFPIPQKHTIATFRKFGTRPAMDISVVSVGMSALYKNARLSNVRVAFGAVAPIPKRGRKTEAALEGMSVDEIDIPAILEVAKSEVSPISDIRASAWYRTQLLCHLVERTIADVTERRN